MVIGVVPKRITVVDRQNALTSGLFQVTTPYFYDPINGAIQPVGLVTQAPSLRGPLYNFDGSSFLRYVNDRRLTPPYSVVCDVIFRTVGFDVFQPVVSQGGGGATFGFKVAIASNGLRSTFGGVFDYFISGSFSANTMYRVCVTVSGNGGTAIAYVNGSAIGSVAVGTMLTPASTGTLIGADAVGGRVLNGTRIGNVALWNRALSADEVLLLNNSSLLSTQPRYVQTDSTPSPTSRTFFVPRKKVMSSQPQGNIQINWDNPITRGLACVYIPQRSPQTPIDPVSGAVAVNNFVATRLPDVLPANGGSALVTNSITGDTRWGFAFDIPNAPAGRTGYPVLSIFSRCEILNTTGEGTIWGAGQVLSPSSDIYIALRFNKFNDRIDLVPSSNAGGNITGPTFSTNRVYNLGGVQRFTNNYRAYYIDGALYNSNTSNFNNLNGGFQAGSAYKLNATSFQSKVYCGYVWQRELTAAEMQSLSDNPWQIFKQPRLSPALAEDGKVYAPFMS
jgi:hypothetical protein